MCVNPVKVRNPYYRQPVYKYEEGELYSLDHRYVSSEEFITVPCGKCADCRSSYVLSVVQRCQMEARTSYVYFVTLTYRDSDLPTLTFTTEDGQKIDIFYADITHIQALVKRLRNLPKFRDRDFRMLYVTEYGSEKFRPHHHMMFFVGCKKTDDDTTPFYFERYLKASIYMLYGENIGTRKHPVYRKYFDYRERWINGKKNTTFSVQLVRDYSLEPNDPRAINSEDSVSAACHYLISYLNKPSRYEDSLTEFVDKMSDILDDELSRRLKRLLRSRLEYSKHFGWGFDDDGRKIKPSLRYQTYTLTSCYYGENINNLPKTYEEFSNLNSDLAYLVDIWRYKLPNHIIFDKSNIKSFFDWANINRIDPLVIRILTHYFPDIVQSFIYLNHLDCTSINLYWTPKLPYDDSYKSSVTYKEIRKMIDCVPVDVQFIPFEFYQKGKIQYVPLCRYFRRYVCTESDYKDLYFRAGVQNFDDYQKLFEHNQALSDQRARAQLNNRDKHDTRRIHYGEEFVPKSKNIAVILNKLRKISIFAPTCDTLDKLLKYIGR